MNATKLARECGLIATPHVHSYECDCPNDYYEIAPRHVAPREPIELPCGDDVCEASPIVEACILICGVIVTLAVVSKLVTGGWF